MTPTLVVMAAGLGSRYGGSKQIDGVGPHGETLLEYAVFDARRAGFGRVVFIIREELADAFDRLMAGLSAHVEVARVVQDPADVPSWFTPPPRQKPWGTTHAVLAARHVVHTPFVVINADDFYGSASYALGAEACALADRTGAFAVIGLPVAATLSEHGPVARGICESSGGWLTRIDEVRGVEKTAAGIRGVHHGGSRVLSGHEMASMNFWVFTPAIFDLLRERFDAFLRDHGNDPDAESALPEAINDLLAAGALRIRARETPGPWFGMTHAQDRARVTSFLRDLVAAGAYPDPLWGGAGHHAATPRP